MKMLYLNRKDVESLEIPAIDVINAVEEGFRVKGEGKVELPPKPGVHPRKDTFIHAMPAYLGDSVDAVGLKWVSGYPSNPGRGLPYIMGLIVLNDPDTGIPKALMDCTWVTEYRTAAASALAIKYMAPEKAEILSLIGLGVQGRVHLIALKEVMPSLKEVKLYDIKDEITKIFLKEMPSYAPGVDFKVEKDVKSALLEGDVVVTCTPIVEEPERFIPEKWLKEKSLAISVDYDSAFCADVMTGAGVFIVDDRGQYLWTQDQGVYFKGYPSPFADMGEICAGKKKIQENVWRRSAVLMGIASHDVVTAGLIYKKAIEKNRGIWLEL